MSVSTYPVLVTLAALIIDYGGVLTDHPDLSAVGATLPGVVQQVRDAGIRTALLSNAVADAYSPEIRVMFDEVMLSSELGSSKPDVEVYRLTARRLGVATSQCVFVDDQWSNVAGAVEAGMVGVHHRSVSSTVDELRILFGC